MTPAAPLDPLSPLYAEAAALVVVVERLTGRTSAWSGTLLVGTDLNGAGRAAYHGAKPWNCDIVIHQDRLARVGRHSTLLHEMFHSVSVGLKQPEYDLWKGYEEGVVEACTRLFRDALFAAAGLPPAADIRASYDSEIALLELLWARTRRADTDAYLTLLAAPLPDREQLVLQWIQDAEPFRTPAQIAQQTLPLRTGLRL